MTKAIMIASRNAVCKGLPQTARLLRLRSTSAIAKPLTNRRRPLKRLLDIYERGWMFKSVLTRLDGAGARYVRALASRYNSWIARQVA